jgi:hypothetical protein
VWLVAWLRAKRGAAVGGVGELLLLLWRFGGVVAASLEGQRSCCTGVVLSVSVCVCFLATTGKGKREAGRLGMQDDLLAGGSSSSSGRTVGCSLCTGCAYVYVHYIGKSVLLTRVGRLNGASVAGEARGEWQAWWPARVAGTGASVQLGSAHVARALTILPHDKPARRSSGLRLLLPRVVQARVYKL